MKKKCNYNNLEVSKNNLKKIKEIRDKGKLTNLDSIEACSLEQMVRQDIPIPIWYPKRVPTRITLNDIPTIPTSKIIGTFDNSNIIIDGGKP